MAPGNAGTAKLSRNLNISPADIEGLVKIAREKSIELVVIGTHGQKGLQLLLGSTANAVLHGAGCDVLSVRVGAKA